MTTDDVIRIVRPRYARIVSPCLPKEQRLPEFDELWPDVQRLAWSVAEKHSDVTCVELHTDEIFGALLHKFATLVDKERFDKMNRRDFFKYVKTAFTNTSRGLVHRHKHTQKRSSGALMPLGETAQASEVSLDDDESHIHVGEEPSQYDAMRVSEMKDYIRAALLPIERFVFDCLVDQPPEAAIIMELEGSVGRKLRETPRRFNVDSCMAAGVGLPKPIWEALVKQVRKKTQQVLSTMDAETTQATTEKSYSQAILELQATFGVHVPTSLDHKVASRLFTIAARHQYKKVCDDENVKSNLRTVNAILPEKLGMTFSCFGVMFNSGRAECRNCSVSSQCTEKAKLHGFEEEVVDFTHFPTNMQTRTAVLGATPVSSDTPAESAEPVGVVVPAQEASTDDMLRDQEVRAYLNENFKQSKNTKTDEVNYRDGKNVIFVVSTQAHRTHIRFCAPSAEVQRKLTKEDRSWYLPQDMPTKQALKLLDTHAKQKFQQ